MADNRTKKRKSPFVIVLMVLLLVGTVGTVMAKYVFSTQLDGIFRAKEFYFTSDILGEENPQYAINRDAESIVFTIKNAADELRCSEDEIVYTATLTDRDGGPIYTAKLDNLSTAETETGTTLGGTLAGGSVNGTKIKIYDIKKGESYKVTVTATMGTNLENRIYGYTKTLSATFVPGEEEQVIYKHLSKDTEEYVVLTVWTQNLSGSVDIAYSAENAVKILPDNTDKAMRNTFVQDDAISFSDTTNFAQPYSSYSYRFFVAEGDIDDITAEHFIVTIGTQKAEPNTP